MCEGVIRYKVRRKDGSYYKETRLSEYFGNLAIWENNGGYLFQSRIVAEVTAEELDAEVEECFIVSVKDLKDETQNGHIRDNSNV